MGEIERREPQAMTPATFPNIVTGEIVDASKAEQLVAYVEDLKAHERQIKEIRRNVEGFIFQHAEQLGTKTLRFGKLEAKIVGGPELRWDITVLNELLDAGLPIDRYTELVTETVDYKVNAAVARQLEAANETYAEIIGRARSYEEKPRRVSTRHGS